MVEKIAKELTFKMISSELIKAEKEDYYIYAIVSIFEKIIVFGTILVIGIANKIILPTLVFWVGFMGLRKRTNGFHAKKFYMCYIGTIIIYCMVIVIEPFLTNYKYLMYTVVILAASIIVVIGVINHPNMDLTKEEFVDSKRASRWFVLLEICILGMLIMLKVEQIYISYYSMGIIICAILMCIAKVTKQEIKIK
ncbi:MAG: accessory gene regulator B family protein [Candidatus Galacturonibacter soehngenii]|nr:accessory gene regulator B family protein [Candidatus Galacturonibacter soehngenii]